MSDISERIVFEQVLEVASSRVDRDSSHSGQRDELTFLSVLDSFNAVSKEQGLDKYVHSVCYQALLMRNAIPASCAEKLARPDKYIKRKRGVKFE